MTSPRTRVRTAALCPALWTRYPAVLHWSLMSAAILPLRGGWRQT